MGRVHGLDGSRDDAARGHQSLLLFPNFTLARARWRHVGRVEQVAWCSAWSNSRSASSRPPRRRIVYPDTRPRHFPSSRLVKTRRDCSRFETCPDLPRQNQHPNPSEIPVYPRLGPYLYKCAGRSRHHPGLALDQVDASASDGGWRTGVGGRWDGAIPASSGEQGHREPRLARTYTRCRAAVAPGHWARYSVSGLRYAPVALQPNTDSTILTLISTRNPHSTLKPA